MSCQLSVIICTYNPNEQIFSKCLKSISEASKQYSPNEVIIIDNNSNVPLKSHGYIQDFLSENSNARIVLEEKQGLTPARIRGIAECQGEILIFIDDDNFIREDFFLKGVQIAAANPHIGSWSGQVKLIFEEEPEQWTRKYWGLLVYRVFDTNTWSNLPHLAETMPCGAGLFVRKNVADHYVDLHKHSKRAIQLDRNANSLLSGGDNDLAACACDIGFGVGLFHELTLDHFIPKKRLTKEYLLALTEGIAASGVVFRSFRNENPPKLSLKNKFANSLRLLVKRGVDRKFYRAFLKGEKNGRTILLKYQHELH